MATLTLNRDPYQSMASLLAGRPQSAAAPAPSGSYGAPGTPYAAASAPPAPAPAVPRDNAINALAANPQPSATPTPVASTSGSITDTLKAAGGNSNEQKMAPYWNSVWEGIQGKDADDLNEYIRYVQTWPKYKGSYEAQRVAIANYARQLRMNAKDNAQQDFGGLAKLGDENRSLADQLSATLAARGHAAGGGVAAGALSNLNAKTGANVEEYLSEQDAQKRRERLAIRLAQMQNDGRMEEAALAANRQEQNDPGLFGDILGAAGNLVPLIGGLIP